MNRGDVYWVNFDPALGSEIKKMRPAIIVSNNLNNHYMSRIQVIPLTSNIKKIYPCETIVVIRGKQGKALADQITTIDKIRIGEYLGTLTTSELTNVDTIIRLQLAL